MKPPAKPQAGSFQAMGLSQDLFRGIMTMGYKVPTPVQRKSLPVSLAGADVVVMARTGSGKTAAFLIPVLEKLGAHSHKMGARSIILSPTRELAVQTLKFARNMSKFKNLRMALLVGGDSMDRQFTALADNPDVIIATPGRLMHHLQEVPEFSLRSVEVIVFDEADRLFEMGFAEQLREIMRGVSEERQSLLFSATMPKQLVQFARAGLKDPALIRLDTESKISTELSLAFLTCRSADKPAALLFLLREVISPHDMTIVFVATRHHAEFIHELLKEAGTESSVVYGAMDQEARSLNLDRFRKGKTKLLVVTDVAARGIDVPLLNNVVNYAFPPSPKLFVHRVGRAARQGRTGTAYNLVGPEEIPFMLDLHLFLGRKPSNVFTRGDDEESCQQGDDVENGEGGGGEGDGQKRRAIEGYEMSELRPDLVHYGNLPQQVMDDENESLKEMLGRGGSNLAALQKVCGNAMKQYKRTRPDPSGRAIMRAKELDRGETHPLLLKFEARGMHSAAAHLGRNEFLRAMSSFRPKETIFEVLGGGGTDSKGDAEQVMVAVRKTARRHRLLARNGEDRSDSTVPEPAAPASESPKMPRDEHTNSLGGRQANGDYGGRGDSGAIAATVEESEPMDVEGGGSVGGASAKRKLSRFERKQLKKKKVAGGGGSNGNEQEQEKGMGEGGDALAGLDDEDVPADDGGRGGLGGVIGKDGPGRFADKAFYIGYGTTEESAFVEASLQPRSVEKSSDGFAAGRLEEAILDVNPDEAVDMAKRKRVLHWDSRKKKYIKTTLAELGENKKGGSRKIRTESGAVVRAKSAPQGELYAKWKRNSNRKVGREGDEDDQSRAPEATMSGSRGRRGRLDHGTTNEATGDGGRVAKDELRNKSQIHKAKQKEEDIKLKNMPKAKRRALLKKRKEKDGDPRKQAVKKQLQLKGRTRSRMRVKI